MWRTVPYDDMNQLAAEASTLGQVNKACNKLPYQGIQVTSFWLMLHTHVPLKPSPIQPRSEL
jgi:hypothetical protein